MQKKNVIIGLGKTGLSCVQYCLREGWPVAVTDSRMHPPEENALPSSVPTAFGELSAEWIRDADRLIISPGVSLREPVIADAIRRGTECIGDIELFARDVGVPIIAITGSNAKSTVTDLVGEMAKASGINVRIAGNIGTPVLDLLTEPLADLYVLELSSFQLETTHSLRPSIAVVLNVSEDHMDRYDDLAAYRAAKMRIYNNCQTAVINLDDPTLWPQDIPVHIGFSQQQKLPVSLKLKGSHNVQNALAALAIGEAADFDLEAMLRVLQTYEGLPHRCQFVCTVRGVDWYNDSKGTNVGATVAAIQGLGPEYKKIILIAGGIGKAADFSPLIKPVKQHVRTAILFGQDALQLEKTLQSACSIHTVNNLEEAVRAAYDIAQPGEAVLLSPACSSLDMFENYMERGDLFMHYVKSLCP